MRLTVIDARGPSRGELLSEYARRSPRAVDLEVEGEELTRHELEGRAVELLELERHRVPGLVRDGADAERSGRERAGRGVALRAPALDEERAPLTPEVARQPTQVRL